MGVRDGMPIGIGYFAISFAFGIMAVSYGFSIPEALLISAFNLTSAGQLAALPIIASFGSYIELILTQFLINLRYSLMSISLSQSFDGRIRTKDKLLIAFGVTDEVFAVAIGKRQTLGRKYLFSLLIAPYLGWTLGTLFGALAGNILPELVVTALGVSMYAMFIAIVVPAAKDEKPIFFCILMSVVLSSAFEFIPALSAVPSGFAIIISALIASVTMASLYPIKDEEETEDERS